jgi:hypothetical protein
MFQVALIALSIIFVSPAEARPTHRVHRDGLYAPAITPPYGNIFGAQRSGVAPSTAIPESRSVYIVPQAKSSHTGGIND